MIQLLLHAIGDYIVQNDWMALNKKKKTLQGEFACQVHCITYALPFFLITDWLGVLLIYLSHYIIDRTNIIAWFIAFKNGVKDIKNFGFHHERPFAISIWLYIIVDNIFHIVCNYLIIKYLN